MPAIRRRMLQLLAAVSGGMYVAACGGGDAHTLSAQQPGGAAVESKVAAVPSAVTLPRDLFATSASEPLLGSKVDFTLVPIQKVFSPELFAVGVNGSELVLVHGKAAAGAPRIGAMAKVIGTVHEISKLPQAKSIAASSTEFQLSRVYVEADELQIV